MSEVVAMAGQAYMKQLQTHPLRTKAITSGVLAGCSDAVAQKISGVTKLQLRRLLLIALYGFAYAGPFGHFLHKLMDRFFKGKKGKETTAKKVLVEQLTASPWNNMMFMMYYGLVIEGRPFGQVKSKVKKDYASVQLTAWKFWPIVSWINYEYMPLQLRVLFHSFVASCWLVNTANQVRIIIPDSDDEQDNSKKPSPSKASGSSKRKQMPLRQMVQQLKERYDDLREQIENLNIDIAGTQEDMEMTLKEFMETVANKLEVMAKKIRKLQDKVNRK